jgi:hypothetical protein
VLARGIDIKRLLALLALTATLGLSAGCGGGDEADKGQAQTEQTTEQAPQPTTETEAEAEPETETEPEPPADAKDPEGAFLAFQSALADGDKDAICDGLLAPSAVKQAEEASIGGKCDTWVEELSGVYSSDPDTKKKLKGTKVDSVDEQGGKATLEYTSPILNLPLEVELEKAGEDWKISKLAEGV